MVLPVKTRYTDGPGIARWPSTTKREVVGNTFEGRKDLDPKPENPFAIQVDGWDPNTKTPEAGMKIPGMPYGERVDMDDDPDRW